MTSTKRAPLLANALGEHELLARLGLSGGASDQEVEAARDSIAGFLATAPRDLRAWAQRETAIVDEAYALLSDGVDVSLADAVVPAAAAAPSIRSTPESRPVQGSARLRRPTLSPLVKVLVAAGALALVVGVGYGVYAAGSPAVPGFTGTPAPEASASPAIDQAKVADLMQKITTNPKDTASLLELGNIYFDAGDYKSAGDFMAKVVAIDPKNADALVGLGAATFNQGDDATAEADWRKAIALDPKKQEAYYDLGFMYLSKNPPDMTNVKAMWNEVLAIDPTTAIAQTVKTHLDSFSASASPASSPAGPSGAASSPSVPASSGSPVDPSASPAAVPSASPSSGN